MLLSFGAHGQASLDGSLQHRLDSVALADVPTGGPGMATAIIRDGQVIYQQVAGYANLEDSTLLSATSRFNIASNGKQFTALGILLLVEAGELALTDDVRKYVPELYPHFDQTITLAQLLTHRSGLRDVYDLWSLQGYTWWEQPFTQSDALLLLAQQQDLNFEPGTEYLYSNSNYMVLAEVITRVSGQSFSEYMDGVFAKLGMPNTHFEPNPLAMEGVVARPYFNFDTWVTYDWTWNIVGDGNLFSSLADQVQWERLLQGAVSSEIPQRVLRASQLPVPGYPEANYGYGLEFGEWQGQPYRYHEGATGAWKAITMRVPGQGVTLITLTNSGKIGPTYQTYRMAEVLLGASESGDDDFPIVPPPSVGNFSTEELAGVYLTPEYYRFDLVQQGEKLILKRDNRSDVELERERGDVFHQTYDPPFKQAFARDATGRLTVTAYYPGVHPFTLTKPAPIPDGFDYVGLNGTYGNDETGTQFSVTHQGGSQYEVMYNGQELLGQLVSPEKMLVSGYVLEIRSAHEFWLSNDRLRRVSFVRQ